MDRKLVLADCRTPTFYNHFFLMKNAINSKTEYIDIGRQPARLCGVFQNLRWGTPGSHLVINQGATQGDDHDAAKLASMWLFLRGTGIHDRPNQVHYVIKSKHKISISLNKKN